MFLNIASANTAQAEFNHTGLPLPRFASLRTNEVNVRSGPGVKYPLKWIYLRKDYPVLIVAEFEQWRKVQDLTGKSGWVHKVMLSNHRTVIIHKKLAELYSKPEHGKIIAAIEQNKTADFKRCDGQWCLIQVQKLQGWVHREDIWGIFEQE